jgi:hypothetical protein
MTGHPSRRVPADKSVERDVQERNAVGVDARDARRLRDIILDCRSPAVLARFWARALDWPEPQWDASDLAQLAAGASVLHRPPGEHSEHRWMVMGDPEGNEFCARFRHDDRKSG